MKIEIREINHSEVSQLVPLVEQLGYRCSANDLMGRYKNIQDSSDAAIFVALVETGIICGYAQLGIFRSLHFPESVEIIAMVVDEKLRGNGVGKHLIEAAEKWAKNRGLGHVWLRSGIKREAAHAFYKSVGYATTATSHKFEKTIDH